MSSSHEQTVNDLTVFRESLAARIAEAIEIRGLTQRAAAEQIGISQPNLCRIVRGRLQGTGVAQLLNCLVRLGHDVDLTVKRAAPGSYGRMRAVAETHAP